MSENTTTSTTTTPAGFSAVPGNYIQKFVANRWESENLTAQLYKDDRGNDGIYFTATLKDGSVHTAEQVIRELTAWVEAVKSGERYPEFRGTEPDYLTHFVVDDYGVLVLRPEGIHEEEISLCGEDINPWFDAGRNAPMCPNCAEKVREFYEQGQDAISKVKELEAQG